MRRSALTPVARRLRDVMVQRYPVYPPAVNLNALNNTDWTEVAINVPRLSASYSMDAERSSKGLLHLNKLLRNTFGADIFIMVGTLLAFVGSAVTIFASYGSFASPETRPLVLGLGPPLIGIGFLFCLLRLFFCRSRNLCMHCTAYCQGPAAEDETKTKTGASGRLFTVMSGKKVHPILEQIQYGHNGLHINGTIKNGCPEASSSGNAERKYNGPIWTIT
ncbi:uncharacterized protein LOC111251788 isoform X2 [Varroa destructor]|nr:uncharacterized protein LOC111251788 isoform X2 [Varroa destructor]